MADVPPTRKSEIDEIARALEAGKDMAERAGLCPGQWLHAWAERQQRWSEPLDRLKLHAMIEAFTGIRA